MKRVYLFAAVISLSKILQAQSEPSAEQVAQGTVQRYASVLALSSTQQEQALTIFTAEETSELPLRAAQQTAKKALVSAIEANDISSVATLSATLGGLYGQHTQIESTANASLYAILTTEQQARFAIFLEQNSNSRPGGPGGPGGMRR